MSIQDPPHLSEVGDINTSLNSIVIRHFLQPVLPQLQVHEKLVMNRMGGWGLLMLCVIVPIIKKTNQIIRAYSVLKCQICGYQLSSR